MKIEAYGLQLTPLKEEDLELVRTWRNSPVVKKNMFFKKNITKTMQKEWFATLDNTSIYLMIRYNNVKIGVINAKHIDWENKTGEAGIFIGNVTYLKSLIPIAAIILFMDTLFDTLHLYSLNAKVLKSNKNALQLNKSLGYHIIKEDDDCYYLTVIASEYKSSTSRFKIVLSKMKDLEFSSSINDII